MFLTVVKVLQKFVCFRFSAIANCELKILRKKNYLDKQNLFKLAPKIVLLKFLANFVRKKIEKEHVLIAIQVFDILANLIPDKTSKKRQKSVEN